MHLLTRRRIRPKKFPACRGFTPVSPNLPVHRGLLRADVIYIRATLSSPPAESGEFVRPKLVIGGIHKFPQPLRDINPLFTEKWRCSRGAT